MNPSVWSLHVDVFELARACGLERYRVNTKRYASGVLIELTVDAPPDLLLADACPESADHPHHHHHLSPAPAPAPAPAPEPASGLALSDGP
ncbi:MAG TPA: hypothetical protein VHV30_03955 [Polyangiaceae bacterium]|jgi:hypothetical protein|nr:hypothetical protein [Polyangiaceae bacterium]